MIQGLVFDIDDTLVDERDYVRSGFAEVARSIAASTAESEAAFDWLWRAFESGRRGDTFNGLLETFPDLASRATVSELVDRYRSHTPVIALAPGFAQVLDALADRGLRLGVLSDGPAASQSAKATALELPRWFDPIVLTGALGPEHAKPATRGFATIATAWDLDAAALAYVADNPEKDFAGPRQLGWATVRLRRPAQLRFRLEAETPAFAPDHEIQDPAALLSWIDRYDGPGASDRP